MPKPGFQQRVDGHGGQARDGLVNPRGGRQAAGGDRRQDRGGGDHVQALLAGGPFSE
jgi:hypothetical protein